jgi:hypothetical protein
VAVGAAAALSVRHASQRWSWIETIARRASYVSGILIIAVGLYVGFQGWAGLAARAARSQRSRPMLDQLIAMQRWIYAALSPDLTTFAITRDGTALAAVLAGGGRFCLSSGNAGRASRATSIIGEQS